MAGRKIGLLIGNGSFGAASGFAPLRCPANDVAGLARLLEDEKHGGFAVRTLVDRKHEEIAVALLEVLRDTVASDDTVMVYYSGHGSPDEDGNLILAAADTTKKALDATGLALEYVVKWMRRARSQKIVLILDCCFSGSVERLFTRGETADQVRAALPKEFSGTGMYVLTASTATQVAEEKEGDEYGLLTKHILRGIGEGCADSNEDGVVTMHELTVYVQEAVKQEGRQEPLGFALRAGGGEMEIARTGRAAMGTKREEVEAAIWRARREFHVPEEVILQVWGLITQQMLEREGEAARRRLVQLHGLIGDFGSFVSKVYELGMAERRVDVGTRLEPMAPLLVNLEAQREPTAPLHEKPSLFPLYGITLGKTTVRELAKMGRRTTTIDPATGEPFHCYEVRNVDFYGEASSIVDRMYFTHKKPMPQQWRGVGLEWERSYNQWLALLEALSYTIEVKGQPSVKEFNGHSSFFAEVVGIRKNSSSHKIKLTFAFRRGTTKSSGETLYSISVARLDYLGPW